MTVVVVGVSRTDIDDIAATAGIKVQGRVARWAILSIKLADKLVKACLMRYMGTLELQYALAA